jgi:hypothetical protein
MSKLRLNRKNARLLAAALLAALIGAAYSIIDERVNRDRHIAWNELNLSNLEKFEAQMRQALPPGTSKQEVEAYLTGEKIPYDHHEVASRYFFIRLNKIGRRLIVFEGDLTIQISFDPDQRAEEIRFHVQYK